MDKRIKIGMVCKNQVTEETALAWSEKEIVVAL